MMRGLLAGARDDRGQTVVLLAISMPLFLALFLLVIDGGRLLVERERLLATARLSAQAGVAAFDELGQGNRPLTDAEVRAVASDAVGRNLPGETVRSTIGIDRPKRRVDVRLEKPLGAVFGRLVVPVGGSFVAAGAAPPATRAPATPAPTPAPTVRPTPTPPPLATPAPTPVPTATPWRPTVLATQDLSNGTNEITFSGSSLYVALSSPGSGIGPGQLAILDGALKDRPTTLQVGAYPSGVAVDAARGRAYLAHVYPPKLTIVDLKGPKVVTEVPTTGYRAQKVELDRAAGKVYVTAFCDSVSACNDYAVLVFDAASGARLDTIKLDRRPQEIFVDSSRKRAYAHELFDGSISIIDTASNTVQGRVQLPSRSEAVVFDEARGLIYALDWYSNGSFISVIDGASGRITGKIETGISGSAIGLALDPSTGRLYTSATTAYTYDPVKKTHSTESTIVAVDTQSGRVLGTYKYPGNAGRLAVDPASHRLYSTLGRRISVLTG